MSEKKLHIVSFDIPYPANYGGVIDVFFKVKALHAEGWKIHLHCFVYGRKETSELNKYCYKVSYYGRDISRSKLFLKLPYIVSSRNSKLLTETLLKNKAPILFEGLHTTYPLNDKRLWERPVIVRAHNIEHKYYRHLGSAESNLFKRYYFNSEATKLEAYEPILNKTKGIAAISDSETKYFQKNYGNKAFYLPAFHPYDTVENPTGTGDYTLYHANLAVAENHKSALFLIREVYNNLTVPLIISGSYPNAEMKAAIKAQPNISLVENPSNEEMEKLISEAQIHVLPAFQSTGIKLKLLAALFKGRHVIANSMMLEGSGLEELCEIANDAKSFKEKIEKLFTVPLSENKRAKRESLLTKQFSNFNNAKILDDYFNAD